MKGWLDPVGQEPTRTYWIRRGVVAAVIIALVVTISLLVTRPGSNRQQVATTAVAAPPSTSAVPTSTAPTQSPDAAGEEASLGPELGPTQPAAEEDEETPAEETPAEPAEPVACLSRQLNLRIEGPDTVAGQEPTVLTVVASTNQAECVLDLTDPQATVVSLDDRIWSTAAAPVAARRDLQLVGRRVRYVGWPVRRSAAANFAAGEPAPGGNREHRLGPGRHVMQLQPEPASGGHRRPSTLSVDARRLTPGGPDDRSPQHGVRFPALGKCTP